MYELIGDSRAAAYLIPLITVGLGGAVGWWIKSLIGPASEPKNANELGRRWAGWIVLGTCMSMLSQFFGKLDFLSLFKWLVGGGTWVAVAYVLGWVYGKFSKFKSAAPSPSSSAPNTSSNSYSPPAEKNTSNQPLQPTHAEAHVEVGENAIYAVIAEELKSGNTDQGLWTRLFAECDGDENKTRARYISHRARQLLAKVSLGAEQQPQPQPQPQPVKLARRGKSYLPITAGAIILLLALHNPIDGYVTTTSYCDHSAIEQNGGPYQPTKQPDGYVSPNEFAKTICSDIRGQSWQVIQDLSVLDFESNGAILPPLRKLSGLLFWIALVLIVLAVWLQTRNIKEQARRHVERPRTDLPTESKRLGTYSRKSYIAVCSVLTLLIAAIFGWKYWGDRTAESPKYVEGEKWAFVVYYFQANPGKSALDNVFDQKQIERTTTTQVRLSSAKHLQFVHEGPLMIDNSVSDEMPGTDFLKFPLSAESTWTRYDQLRGKEIKYSTGQWEKVSTPAGTFDALKVTEESLNGFVGWYAPAVKTFVKRDGGYKEVLLSYSSPIK